MADSNPAFSICDEIVFLDWLLEETKISNRNSIFSLDTKAKRSLRKPKHPPAKRAAKKAKQTNLSTRERKALRRYVGAIKGGAK